MAIVQPKLIGPDRALYRPPPLVSLAVFAWNEEGSIGSALESIFEQTLFEALAKRGEWVEVICVANGCTDRTAEAAAGALERQGREHPHRQAFSGRVVSIAARGKLNAWNQYVHVHAAREAKFLFMMDADIVIHRGETLARMLGVLEGDPAAHVAVDRPCKDLAFRAPRSWRERLSRGASELTAASEAQLCAQLYGIRSEIARNIYLPRDLGACEDGLIKGLVCTDFLEHEVWPRRIRLAQGAEHTFEAYTTPGAILRNQKRQILGQTVVHILIDQHWRALPAAQRQRLAEVVKAQEAADPAWLRRLIQGHLARVRWPWRLYPGLLSHRFKGWTRLRGRERLRCLPAALGGMALSLLASVLAWRALRGGTTNYWPAAPRPGKQTTDAPRASAVKLAAVAEDRA